jgi:hypothetical protein
MLPLFYLFLLSFGFAPRRVSSIDFASMRQTIIPPIVVRKIPMMMSAQGFMPLAPN